MSWKRKSILKYQSLFIVQASCTIRPNVITNVLVSVIVARLVISHSSDHMIFNSVAGNVRSPCQLFPPSQALACQAALRHRIMYGEEGLQGLG